MCWTRTPLEDRTGRMIAPVYPAPSRPFQLLRGSIIPGLAFIGISLISSTTAFSVSWLENGLLRKRSCGLHTAAFQQKLCEIPILDVLALEEYPDTVTATTSKNPAASDERITVPMIQPLPSDHLPNELRTGHVYGMQLTVPLHQRIIQHAVEDTRDQTFGHLAAYAPPPISSDDTTSGDKSTSGIATTNRLVGAIGCTARVLMNAPAQDVTVGLMDNETSDVSRQSLSLQPTFVLCLGLYRFIVREVIQTIPYVVALVEELHDDDSEDENNSDIVKLARTMSDRSNPEEEEEEGDKEFEDDDFTNLSATELVQRTLRAMQAAVDQQLEELSKLKSERSLLEESILEQMNNSGDPSAAMPQPDVMAMAAQQAAEETAAVWQVFQQALVDEFVTPKERYYAIANMAAELCNLDNATRRAMLTITRPIQRLRLMCARAEESVGMARARRVASEITNASDDASKTLTVGTPVLPSWAHTIRSGTAVEYYWNEEYAWCRGTVVADPVWIVDELILTVFFPDDQSTHRLPFTADEKARWRPASTLSSE